MRKIESATIGVLFGAVPIITGFISGWWISIPFVPEAWISKFAITGLAIGVLIDLFFLKRCVRNAYSMKPIVWMILYLFYSIGMFGFFMGIPIFNIALTVPAGFFMGGWLSYIRADINQMQRIARQAALFTTSVFALICIASATIALTSSSTASDLQGMFSFSFQITPAMIIGIILCGGIILILLQWWLTFKSVERAYKYFLK
jgi:hypothetical protein